MLEKPDFEQTPYELKRLGNLGKALEGYAVEFATALDKKSQFLAEECFNQMLDIVLMRYMQQKQCFPNKQSLMTQAQHELEEVLSNVFDKTVAQRYVRATSSEYISDQMARCESMLFPRGRGKVRFSVDPSWLVSEEEAFSHPKQA